MTTTYSGKLDDGRTFVFTASDSADVVVTIAGVQVYPVPPVVVPPTNATVILKGGSLDSTKRVYTQGDYILTCVGQYTGGFQFAYGTKVLGPGTYQDKITVKRADGAAFTLTSLSLIGDDVNTYTITGDTAVTMAKGGILPNFKPRTDDAGKTYYFSMKGSGAPGIVSMQIGSGSPAPIDPPVVVPPVATTHEFGGISDGSSASVHAPFFKSVNMKGIRIWVSFDEKTGDLNGGDAKIDSINAYFALGITPRIVFTPNTDLTTAPGIPTAAINRMIARLDKRVQINLINEPNLDQYWPGGQSKNAWLGAFQWADQVAGLLKAGGFKLIGSPSFTGWIENWSSWYDQLIAANLVKNFTVLCFHIYPNTDLTSNPTGWQSLFKTMCELARTQANKVAAKVGHVMQVDFDEYGFGKFVSEDIAAANTPFVVKTLAANADKSAYFIVGRSGSDAVPKHPHDDYPWFVDFKTTPYTLRSKLIAAWTLATKGAT